METEGLVGPVEVLGQFEAVQGWAECWYVVTLEREMKKIWRVCVWRGWWGQGGGLKCRWDI